MMSFLGVAASHTLTSPIYSHHQCQDIGSRAKPLITQPYGNWKDAREDLNNHAVLQYHKDSMEKLNGFITSCENPNALIEDSIRNSSTRVIYRNRKYLSAIISAIEYCGYQGIPLRRHEDNGPLFNGKGSNVNRGNFNDLIKNMPEFDSELKGSILSFKRNTTYLSKTTQNDLLLCIK